MHRTHCDDGRNTLQQQQQQRKVMDVSSRHTTHTRGGITQTTLTSLVQRLANTASIVVEQPPVHHDLETAVHHAGAAL